MATNDKAKPASRCQGSDSLLVVLLSGCFSVTKKSKRWNCFLEWWNGDVGSRDGKGKCQEKRLVKSSLSVKLKWRKCEERDSMSQGREGWQGWVKHFIFPFSQQNCWELVTYWLLGSDVSLCTTFLPLSFIFLFYLSLHHALSTWLVPNLNVQNRGSKVSRSTFPFCWCCNSSLVGLTILIAVPSAIDGLTPANPTQPCSGLWHNQDPQDLPSSRPRLT